MPFLRKNSDSGLISAAQQGDSEAFSELYRRHVDQIYRYLLARVGDTATAEDLTSEVFLRALESLGSYEHRGIPVVAWLYRIANARAVDFWRKSKHQTLPLNETFVDDKDEMRAKDVLSYRKLSHAMKHLTHKQQQVIVLKFIEGLNSAEISQLIGGTEGAVKALQHRALDSLARQMKHLA